MFSDVVVQGVCVTALLTLLLHPASSAAAGTRKGGAASRLRAWVRWALMEGYVSQRVLAQWTGADNAAVARWLISGIPVHDERQLRELASLVEALSQRCSRQRAASLIARAAVAREHRRLIHLLARDGVAVARRAVASGAFGDDEAALVHAPRFWRMHVRP